MNPSKSTLTGRAFIAGETMIASDGAVFHGVNPATGETLAPAYRATPAAQIDRAAAAAGEAFLAFRVTPPAQRAALLRAIADEIEALGDALLDRYVAETGLPRGRADGERARTCGQLRLFAGEIESAGWDRPREEAADAARTPLPRPRLELRYTGVGPVAVFGPANFPLAFGVAGGDTASALAAGCPVVVKAHPSHPGVCELIGSAIVAALAEVGLPPGVFSLVYGGAAEGAQLVQHAAIAAVGFTGSERAGRALADLAAARPRPIPVMAEMSSVNPVLMLPGALATRPAEIAAGLAASVTLGVGQFCTNPGLVLLPPGEGAATEAFITTLREKLSAAPTAPMLSASLREHYVQGVRALAAEPGVELLLAPADDAGLGGAHATAGLLRVSAKAWLASAALRHEVFGPATLLVTDCDGPLMRRVLETLGGQLTVTLHGEPADLNAAADLLDAAERISGRVVWNGFPTGVEVSAAMVHGGPYPATTDVRFTSVGTRSIDRFLRPVCRQGFGAV